jgi:LytTr DNA-binding domain-containing protein
LASNKKDETLFSFMKQIASIIFYSEEEKFAKMIEKMIDLEALGLLSLGCYTDLVKFHDDLEVEDCALVFICLTPGKLNLKDYLKSLKLMNRKFICIIPENGEYSKELDKMGIQYIALPVTKIKLLVKINSFSKKILIAEIEVIPVVSKNGIIRKQKSIKIPVGVRYIFKVKGGERRIFLDTIVRFYIKNRKLYLVLYTNRSMVITNKITQLTRDLKQFDFASPRRSQLMNLNYVDDIMQKKRIHVVIIAGVEYPMGGKPLNTFTKAWRLHKL